MAEPQYKTENVSYQKGQVIALQGTSLKEILFLKKGNVEVKRCPENVKGFLESELLKKSVRLEIVSTQTILGAEFLLEKKELKNSYIAVSDCELTKITITTENWIDFLKTTPQIALNLLLSMKDLCIRNIGNINYFYKFLAEIHKLADNMELLIASVENDTSNELWSTFTRNNGIFPLKIDANFLLEDHSETLRKKYIEPGSSTKEKYHWSEIDFIHILVKAKPDAFLQIIHTQISVFTYLYNELSNIITLLNADIGKALEQIREKMDELYKNPYSQLQRLLKMGKQLLNSDKVQPSIIKGITDIAKNFDALYQKIGGEKYAGLEGSLKDFLNCMSGSSESTEKQNAGPSQPSEFRKELTGSTKEILNFAEMEEEVSKRIETNVFKIKNINFKEPTEKESRRIIKELQRDFFELFTKIVFKIFKHRAKIPLSVKLFLYLGYINEDLLTDEELDQICRSIHFFENLQRINFPILSAVNFLESIYTGEEVPGLSLNGEDYLKTMKRNAGRQEFVDSPEKRVLYEIDNMLKESMRITSDNPRAYIPYLTSNSLKGPIPNLLNTPQKLETEVKKINEIDPTLFFRELTWKIPGKSELITKEVKPYLILVPNSGVRVQLWQEMVNNQRTSRARLVVPTIFNGQLEKSLILAFAHFRWEINKIIAGANWMDPVEGGLVGAFYDFSQYYHKMNELSLEAKEDIKMLFNKVKMDRDRFAYYYEKWLLYEKDGVAKLNKAVRQIFYRYIPFPSYIRERLSNMPLFEDLDHRYNNINRRNIRSLEARYHKYTTETGELPEDLQAYLDILKK